MSKPATRRRIGGALASTVIAAGIAVTGFSGTAAADDPFGELLITLDASGSMEASDGSDATKMATAQTAVGEVAEAMPDGAKVGLRAYGPASTGSGCKASDVLVPVDTIDRDAITSKVDALKPDGDTPIAYSLEQAATDFTDEPGPKTILLVSDGEETCDGDPIAVAEKLTDQGIDLRIHVIGFQVDDKAREQLTELAKAGHGAYYDAQDGPALASRLKRASEHALRPYETSGIPVDGSTDGLNAPQLEPGQYIDTMPPNAKGEKPSKYYSVELPEDSTVYVAATVPWSTPLEVDAKNAIRAVIRSEDGGQCAWETGYNTPNGGGSAIATTTATVEWDPEADPGKCGSAGRYVVEVNNNDSTDRTGPAPLELVVVIEPALSGTDGLPEPYVEESDKSPTPDVPATATADVTGSGGIGDAPIVETGSYNDILRPGEEVFYRIPVDWGQRLSYQINLPKLNAETDTQLGSGTWVDSDVFNPVRQTATQTESGNGAYFSGDPASVNGSSAPVRYRNRASDDNAIAKTSLSGYYYIGVHMDASVEDPYFELPITLQVEVQGKTGGEPEYDDANSLGTPAEQLSVELAANSESSDKSPTLTTGLSNTALWSGVAIGAVLLLGGGTATWLFLRRRPA